MGYPYGDMAYPTIEEMETGYIRASFGTAFHFELSRLTDKWRTEARKRPIRDENGGYYCEDEPSESEYRDMWGLAFARALAWSADYDSGSLEHFMTDFEALLEDKALTRIDREQSREAEVKENARLYSDYAEMARKAASDPDSHAAHLERQAAEMGLGEHGYADSVEAEAGKLEHMLAQDLAVIRDRYASLIGDDAVSADDRKRALLVADGILTGTLSPEDVKPKAASEE